MTLRQFLNGIFAFISTESLTDEEYDGLPSGLAQDYSKANYDALRGVLISRETISTMGTRLKGYFKAKGLDLSNEPVRIPSSQVFMGAPLQ